MLRVKMRVQMSAVTLSVIRLLYTRKADFDVMYSSRWMAVDWGLQIRLVF